MGLCPTPQFLFENKSLTTETQHEKTNEISKLDIVLAGIVITIPPIIIGALLSTLF